MLILLAGFPALAHKPDQIDPAKTIRAVRCQIESPRIDGRLDDEVWKRAPSYSRFIQGIPDDGEPATEKTLVQFAYDKDALYVAMTLHNSDPDLVLGNLTRRDQTYNVDRFRIEIDAHHDHQTAYMFELSAAGVQRDAHITKNGRGFDGNWDAVWEGRVSSDAEGLTAEWRIPHQALRFQQAEHYTWGINIVRSMPLKHEMVFWSRIPRNESGWVSRFGHLEGIEDISPAGAVEVLPYTVGRTVLHPGSDDDTDLTARVGADVRYDVTHSTSINASINPDFGQVEADPAQLNLTVFETFQSERRPFFVEGAEMFRTPIGLFYSRRIGRHPGYLEVPDGWEESDRPELTTVLGAVKLTGKTQSQTTFGLMEAVTASEHVGVDSAGTLRNVLIEPRSNYLAGRISQDVMGSSQVGLLATALNRSRGDDAWSAGIDWKLLTPDNDYELTGQIAGSQTGVGRGWGSDLEIAKQSGRWQGEFSLKAYSPDFSINEMGFLARPDLIEPRFEIDYANRDPGELFRYSNYWLSHWRRWNFDDVNLEEAVEIGTWHQLLNYWGFGAGFTHRFRASDDRDTRGGPLITTPASDSYWASVGSDGRLRTSGWVDVNWGSDAVGGKSRSLSGELTLKPGANLEVRFRPRYSWNHDDAQWVRNADEDDDGTTDHHIYGELDSKSLDLTTRADLIFSPRLSLELYLQPFVASGDFSNYKRLADPGSYRFVAHEEPDSDHDFRRRSLRSNVVLRWEYHPGSTLFLVWSQDRSDSSDRPRLRGLTNLGRSFADAGTNVLFVKATYWSSL
ncbi:MAG: carbohydrate binding family 9 domain-containing protein [Gemmatimonadetes bacterium]|nr:carbohydrate binding family 9 domain-containing protein [Gemmatimonadota bacterium]MBT7858841.1 carbohydrate binding family 9 domain-containing protein [Gemmatimonadota bacterium]